MCMEAEMNRIALSRTAMTIGAMTVGVMTTGAGAQEVVTNPGKCA